jgi:hypothetical protein
VLVHGKKRQTSCSLILTASAMRWKKTRLAAVP